MKRGWLVVALLLSLGINLGLVGVFLVRNRALARWAMERPEFEPGARLARRLELGPEDQREFVGVQRRLFELARAERQEIQRLRDQIRAELLSAEPDRARLEELLEQVSGHERRLSRAFVDSVLESRDILPPEARERFLRFVEHAAPGGFGPPGRGPEGGPEPGPERPPGRGRDRRGPGPPP